MSDYRVDVVYGTGDSSEISLEDLAVACEVHPDVVMRYVRIGLVEPKSDQSGTVFTFGTLLRVRTILRLRRELGVNLNGAAVILDLTERVRRLQRELDDLRASF
jgi:DNA-binding transcriptional MerR regulator